MAKNTIGDNRMQRIPTNISGLDELLYGGLDIIKAPFCIVIRGGAGTESTLFGLQLLYGIALSLNEEKRGFPMGNDVEPYFMTSCHSKDDIDNRLTDTFISSCLHLLTKRILEKSYTEPDLGILTKLFFDTSEIVCTKNPSPPPPRLPIKSIKDEPDKLIAQNVMYYNRRTRALHYRTADCIADITNMVYPRAHSSIEDYLKGRNRKRLNDTLYRLVRTMLIPTHFCKAPSPLPLSHVRLLGVELDDTRGYKQAAMRTLIHSMKRTATISVLIVDDGTEVPINCADILINLYNKQRHGYVLHILNLMHNSHQDSVLGEHQYKKRDFGIEVFPSLHTYFKKKKNFHRSLVYTHSSVVEDIFPQYLSRKEALGQDDASYEDFVANSRKYMEENMSVFHTADDVKLISHDILKRIFLTDRCPCGGKDFFNDETGLVTAVIGAGNTFKRYLTIGSSFSSAIKHEDTLFMILNKEKHLIQKRMSCPARMRHHCYKPHCMECYKHFHFMVIYPEHITQDEFVYILRQRIRMAYDKPAGRYVRRIIIDDLQILDYCFPMLEGKGDFLSAIMNICREHDISLYILCDKDARSRDVLRALADNIVCTEKTEDGHPRIFVERCFGYYNPPSKLYCGVIGDIERLFECNEQSVGSCKSMLRFTINPLQIEDRTVPNIDKFWQG